MNNTGLAYNYLKEYSKALDCFYQVLQIDPKDTYALVKKGWAHINLNEF